jgi:hypothetical protein
MARNGRIRQRTKKGGRDAGRDATQQKYSSTTRTALSCGWRRCFRLAPGLHSTGTVDVDIPPNVGCRLLPRLFLAATPKLWRAMGAAVSRPGRQGPAIQRLVWCTFSGRSTAVIGSGQLSAYRRLLALVHGGLRALLSGVLRLPVRLQRPERAHRKAKRLPGGNFSFNPFLSYPWHNVPFAII